MTGPETIEFTYFLLFFVVGITLVGSLVWYFDVRPRKKFEDIFGFEPSLQQEEFGVQQRIVDRALARYAESFLWYCNVECVLLQRKSKAAGDRTLWPKAMEKKLQRIQRKDLTYAKEEFWRAHYFARRNCFVVNSKVADYSNTDISRTREEVRLYATAESKETVTSGKETP